MSSTSSSSRASNGGSGTQACAACKYQRRKCTPDCILAPHFPAEKQREFLNAHRLFGVSNILKIIRNLDGPQRAEAMRTITIQADARARDPVGGCYAFILDLWRHIHADLAELHALLRYLVAARDQYARVARAQGTRPPDPLPVFISTHPNFLADPILQHLHLLLPININNLAAASPSPAPSPAPFNINIIPSNSYNHNPHHPHQMVHPQQQQQQLICTSAPADSSSCYNYGNPPPQHMNLQQYCGSSFPGDDVVLDPQHITHHHHHHQLMPPNSNVENEEESSNFNNMDNMNHSRSVANFDNDYDDDVKPHLLGMLDTNPLPLLGNPNESFPCR